jgi:hypothetical protein
MKKGNRKAYMCRYVLRKELKFSEPDSALLKWA